MKNNGIFKIEEVDANFAAVSADGLGEIEWYDAAGGGFDIYGVMHDEDNGFFRMPPDIAETVSPGVAGLCYHTSGGRIRFSTDSPYIAVICENGGCGLMGHMPLLGSNGFDLYRDGYAGSTYAGSAVPPVSEMRENSYFSVIKIKSVNGKTENYTLHMPLYGRVKKLLIGIRKGSVLGNGARYKDIPPVVFYGSSITQGGCASRPGLGYTNMISRLLETDTLNLGFSGSARGERAIREYIAGLDMSAFVSDYDHNAHSAEELEMTHYPLYEAVRRTHPDIPYIAVSRPDARFCDPEDTEKRRSIIRDTVRRARDGGDKNVYFIDGAELFDGAGADECTVDGCHPNDIGFMRMAGKIGAVIADALGIHL